MIKTWRLAHFKSVFDETQLAFAPLTVFTGANSSGKSTIIQSILLTAQTLQSAVIARPVVLNGHIARLGAFPDIVSNSDESSSIEIGFTLAISADEDPGARVRRYDRLRAGVQHYWFPEFAGQIDCDYAFGVKGARADSDIARLQPALDKATIRVLPADADEGPEQVRIARSPRAPAERALEFRIDPQGLSPQHLAAFSYEVQQLTALARRRWTTFPDGIYAGATFLHFLPRTIAVVFDAIEAEVARTMEFVTSPRPAAREELARGGVSLNEAVVELLQQELAATLEAEDQRVSTRLANLHAQFNDSSSAEHFGAVVRALPPHLLASFTQRLTARASEFKAAARAGRPSRYEIQYAPLSEALGFGIEVVQSFFANNLKYLGPLRDEPKPVYPLAGAADPADVGFRGEYTAAVLDVHRRTEVDYIPTRAFAAGTAELPVQTATLLDAVLDWLRYMGVGSRIHTLDRGKLGHELKIATADDQRLQDLTQVGVGVSQVLPILVLSLLAPSGSTLIFEQPELHLHPRVQTRLADFFVAMTRLGKQCVVETHSEYLINRLRFQSATSQGSTVADSVIMYFVEKHEGRSRYRPVRINEFGVIEDWPIGFFDENEENAAALLKAGMQKRRESSRGRDGASDT